MVSIQKSSVFLIPGFGCSVLCKKGNKLKHNSWMEISKMMKPTRWLNDNQVMYKNGRFLSTDDIGVWDFGGVEGVRNLIPELDWLGKDFGQNYYGKMIDDLQGEGAKVIGMPYDFRRISDPLEIAAFVQKMKKHIELQKSKTGKHVVIVTHSMGSLIARYVLSELGDRWTRRNVKAIVEICPAYGGSLYSLEVMIRGSFYVPIMSGEIRDSMAKASREISGLLLTLPNKQAFGNKDPIWITADGQEIRIDDWPWENVQHAWQSCSVPLLEKIRPLPKQVNHILMYGSGQLTPVMVDEYNDKETFDDGDGVLNVKSSVCGGSEKYTNVIELEDCVHRMAPSRDDVIASVKQFL
ncbi:lecithin:cholesterol acyltransferase family protein [Tetraselmis virus 1]|uniref:Lecithin:cholesterol acyltransferase family protein n=1 Tax=Tetraselmis virus 1 TaxID=2060617 RepID=A0A2P0VMW0_9VIRU|nr:lecithin:cholesterol acyltransferase family protein [Tetraselmis virus 1]AUF82244.1 lecithin:cholesterol acyltransferase family protein [Tetraselmis virus 1]